ncbi:MAG: TVP38/TMEM64 family protein [Clostridiales bacterium]|nr:TVP38/TMEM64 family protein [Clostridiales bacterium]
MKSVGMRIFKHIINILATILIGSVAFVFAILGLNYKATHFLASYHAQIASAVFGVLFILILTYAIFYLFNKKTIYRLITITLLFFAFASVVFYIICATDLINKITGIESLREYISNAGNMAVILFVVFQFLQVIILPVPGSVSVAAGVALFGPLKNAVLSFIGITIGSIVAFFIGRIIGFKAVSWIVGKESLEKWMEKVKGKDYLILTLMFLLPLFPDDILCFVAGLSSMSWQFFLVMIVITRAISIFAASYSFGFIPITTWWGILTWAILIALVIASFWFVCKNWDEIDKFVKNKLKLNKNKNN